MSDDVDEESAGAVLHRWPGPLYLLLHYTAGHWGFPKGHIEPGETEVGALLREVHEETGIAPGDVEVLEGFRRDNRYTYRRDGRVRDKVVRYRLARTDVEEVTLSDEHVDHAWLDRDAAVERLTYDDAREILEEAHRVLQEGSGP